MIGFNRFIFMLQHSYTVVRTWNYSGKYTYIEQRKNAYGCVSTYTHLKIYLDISPAYQRDNIGVRGVHPDLFLL